jgi:hypothetical protein
VARAIIDRAQEHLSDQTVIAGVIITQRNRGGERDFVYRFLGDHRFVDAQEVGARLFDGHAGLEPADSIQIPAAVIGGIFLQRDPEIGFVREHRGLGQHADNFVGLIVELENFAEDVACAAEFFLPQAVGEQRNFASALAVLFGKNAAAEQGLDAEGRGKIVADTCRLDALGLA